MKRIWNLFIYAMQNSFKVEGRACRAEILSLMAVQFLISLIFGTLFTVFVFIPVAISSFSGQESPAGVFGLVLYLVYLVFVLALLPAGITLSIRRLHDIDMSGWYILLFFVLSLIPFVNFVVSLVVLYLFYIRLGSEGENKFGAPSPNF